MELGQNSHGAAGATLQDPSASAASAREHGHKCGAQSAAETHANPRRFATPGSAHAEPVSERRAGSIPACVNAAAGAAAACQVAIACAATCSAVACTHSGAEFIPESRRPIHCDRGGVTKRRSTPGGIANATAAALQQVLRVKPGRRPNGVNSKWLWTTCVMSWRPFRRHMTSFG